ncbi:hypothetical protein [Chryseobacterium rhizosphaerae]|uniref:hypothetical protein n=1 Tax=Chryseobacterium rhizosphaerae TaxID=395937 RepID=UPI003D0EB9E4
MMNKRLKKYPERIFLFIGLFFCMSARSQVAIGKTEVNGDGILDFGNLPKGIVLPLLQVLPDNPVNGTFVVDRNDTKVKVFSNGNWLMLTDVTGNSTGRVENLSNDVGKGVIIGNPLSTADGVLILESQNKALILPKVENPHLNIPNPAIGTICYDSISKSLAVYDGNEWHYWK